MPLRNTPRSAWLMVGQGPCVEGAPGGCHRPVHVGRLGFGDPEVDPFGARVDHLEGGLRRGGDPVATDEEAVGVSDGYHGLAQGHLDSPLRCKHAAAG